MARKTTTKETKKTAKKGGSQATAKPAPKKATKPQTLTTNVKGADLKPIKLASQRKQVKYDVTRQNAYISITSPKKGHATRHFKVITQPENSTFFPGRRVAYMFVGEDMNNVCHWRGFAWVDEFGVKTFGTLTGSGNEPSSWEKMAGMLERPQFFTDKGCKYKIKLID